MCVELTVNGQNARVKNSFRTKNGLLAQKKKPSLSARLITDEVYWDGWVKEEEVSNWTSKEWNNVEIFATKFNQRGRWYDVPPGQVIKAIAFSNNKKTILKVITRKSIGRENKIHDRFVLTGKRLLIPRG